MKWQPKKKTQRGERRSSGIPPSEASSPFLGQVADGGSRQVRGSKVQLAAKKPIKANNHSSFVTYNPEGRD